MVANPIADCPIRLIFADGHEILGRIVMRQPYRIDDREARCAFSVDGLMDADHAAIGSDTLQALLRALKEIATQLAAFERQGGKVLRPDGAAFEFDLLANLVRPRPAFLQAEVQWLRFDVNSAFVHSGMGAVFSSETCCHRASTIEPEGKTQH